MIVEEIDELSRDYQSSMQMLDRQLQRLLDVKERAEDKIDRINSDLDGKSKVKKELQRIITTRSRRLKSARKKLQEIEISRAKTLSTISRNEKELQHAEDKIADLEKRQDAARQVISAEQDSIKMTQPMVDTLNTCRTNLLQEFKAARDVLWKSYTDRFAVEIAKVNLIDQERARFKNRLRDFRRACVGDRELAYLWNTRTEWRKALSQLGQGEIGRQISNEIALIETDLMHRYKGILKPNKPKTVVLLQSFLFFVELKKRTYLILPVSQTTWNEIVGEAINYKQSHVAHFLRLLMLQYGNSMNEMQLWEYHGQLLLKINRQIRNNESIAIKLPAGTILKLSCKKLPLINFISKFNRTSNSEEKLNDLVNSNGSQAVSNGSSHHD